MPIKKLVSNSELLSWGTNMCPFLRNTLALFLLVLMTATPLYADNSSGRGLLGAVFSELEKQSIRDYYRGRYGSDISDEKEVGKKSKKKKAKGKKGKKHKGLPPGLAKQLKRNGRLPPGLAKRDLPEGLDQMLPERSGKWERVVVDNDVLLIEQATGLIIDILQDVF